jgi:hypothetical protein
LARSEQRVRRDVKGIGKLIDVRSFVTELALGAESSLEALSRAGLIGRMQPIDLVLELRPDGSARIGEVLEAVLGSREIPHRAVRAALSGESGSLSQAAQRDPGARENAAGV